jgi:hypothetical protein
VAIAHDDDSNSSKTTNGQTEIKVVDDDRYARSDGLRGLRLKQPPPSLSSFSKNAQKRDKNNDEVSGFDSVIAPCDFLTSDVILDDVLFQLVSKINCKATLLFDSCNSGSVCDLPYSLSYSNERIYQSTTKRVARMKNPSIFMMSGCRDTQFSADVQMDGEFCGAFTNAFLKSVQPNKSIFAIYVDVCRKMPNTQVPVLSMSAPVTKAFPAALPTALPSTIPATRKISLARNITGR